MLAGTGSKSAPRWAFLNFATAALGEGHVEVFRMDVDADIQ